MSDALRAPSLRAPAVLAVLAMSLVLLGLAINARVDAGPLDGLDQRVALALNHVVAPHPAAVALWKTVTRIGSPVALDTVSAAAAIVLLVRRQWRTAIFGVVSLIGAAVLSTALKHVTDRPRPRLPVTVDTAAGMSFPSGHALTSLVAVSFLVIAAQALAPRYAGRWLVAVAGTVVLVIGFSRLILGVHFVTDVIGGWLTGALWLLVTNTFIVSGRVGDVMTAHRGRDAQTSPCS